MPSNDQADYLDVPAPRMLYLKSSNQVLEQHSGSKTFKPTNHYADSAESGSLQMTKPKLVHNNSGPDRSKFSGSSKIQVNVSDKASNTSISSESETGQIMVNGERVYGD